MNSWFSLLHGTREKVEEENLKQKIADELDQGCAMKYFTLKYLKKIRRNFEIFQDPFFEIFHEMFTNPKKNNFKNSKNAIYVIIGTAT